MKNLSLFLCIILSNIAEARPVRVLMIDAGKPDKTLSVPGEHLSVDFKQNLHSNAMYRFIVSGTTGAVTCNNVIVDSCTFLDAKGAFNDAMYWYCLDQGIKGKYDIVNMSLSGGRYDVVEFLKISAMKKHSVIVIAAGNNGLPYREYPSAYATTKTGPIYAISALKPDGSIRKDSNRDKLTVDFLGSAWYNNVLVEGTSVAAALFTNKLINEKCGEH